MESFANLTDEMLVKLYAGGNNSAFDILLERYEEKIFSYIFFIVHNQDVADDIFQETFMKAVVTIQQGRYVENGKFQAWITRIAHNLIIDYFRQTRNENCVTMKWSMICSMTSNWLKRMWNPKWCGNRCLMM